MQLVREIGELHAVYQWQFDDNEDLASPKFNSVDDARIWMNARFFSSYSGEERRQRLSDRREDFERRRQSELQLGKMASLNPVGRRQVDGYRFTFIDEMQSLTMKLRAGSATWQMLRG